MPRCPNAQCGAALIYEPEFIDTPARWKCIPCGWMDGIRPKFQERTAKVFPSRISGPEHRLEKAESGIRSVLSQERRCSAWNQRELF